jgi:predicted site-specific integrase-resolvase
MSTANPIAPDLLDETAAAQFLSVAPATLRIWRCTGRYSLPYVKVGRLVRYRRADLSRFLADRTHGEPSPDAR